jgi:Matrixin
MEVYVRGIDLRPLVSTVTIHLWHGATDMEHVGLKYTIMVTGCMALFSNFVACGSKFYQVSLEDDMERNPSRATTAAPSERSDAKLGIHSPNGWADLPIKFSVGSHFKADQKKALLAAMNVWETAVGRKLFEFQGYQKIDGDNFPDLYSSLGDSLNGHYFDANWGKTKKPTSVLATTIWDNDPVNQDAIISADIRYNSENYLLGDSLKIVAMDQREVVDLESLALHELGHLLGLTHVDDADDPYSIMNPALFIGEGLTNRRISAKDVRRLQDIYGCLGDSCNLEKLATIIEAGGSAGESP